MEEEILQILENSSMGEKETKAVYSEIVNLFNDSKRNLLESVLEDMDGTHPEYHYEVVQDYIANYA